MTAPTVERVWIVGQDESCDVRVADQYVSARHCQVTRTADGAYVVVDLGSTNGTYLKTANGRRVKVTAPTPIVPGMTLVVGRSEIPWRPR